MVVVVVVVWVPSVYVINKFKDGSEAHMWTLIFYHNTEQNVPDRLQPGSHLRTIYTIKKNIITVTYCLKVYRFIKEIMPFQIYWSIKWLVS